MLKVVSLTFMLIFYFHVCCCLWFFEVKREAIWIPPLDFGGAKTNLYVDPIHNQYFTTMYYSVLMLTGNEMAPKTVTQLILAAAIILIGAILNANIFGEMAVLV